MMIAQSDRARRIGENVSRGEVKLTRLAYERKEDFKGDARNHLLAQILGFSLRTKQPQIDELLRAFCAGVFLALA
jgi:hypothetical protein